MEITANEILRLIESVSPDNQSALDEINDKVCIYIRGIGRHQYIGNSDYCSSRDALKQIRPHGFCFSLYGTEAGYSINARLTGEPLERHRYFASPDKMPTEELAELHAILQAIEHARNASTGGV
jgi:hypothetical protein